MPVELPGCVGQPFEATCIDDDGELYWYCSGGIEVGACERFTATCEPAPRDSGVPPEG